MVRSLLTENLATPTPTRRAEAKPSGPSVPLQRQEPPGRTPLVTPTILAWHAAASRIAGPNGHLLPEDLASLLCSRMTFQVRGEWTSSPPDVTRRHAVSPPAVRREGGRRAWSVNVACH